MSLAPAADPPPPSPRDQSAGALPNEGRQPAVALAKAGPDDHTLNDGHHLARGAAANLVVLLAANFRGVFTFLIARILGEASLGRFLLAYAALDLLSKGAMLGFDSTIVPLVAPHAAAGDRAGARRTFRRALAATMVAAAALTAAAWPFAVWLSRTGRLDAFTAGESLMLAGVLGMAVARVCTGASRSVLDMTSEFYSRGLVETWVTTGVFVIAIALGIRDLAPALAVALGVTVSAIAGYILAARALTTRIPARDGSRAPRLRSLGDMLRFSLPTAGSSLLTVLVLQADVLMLGAYVNRAPGVTAVTFGVFCAAAEITGGLRKVRQVFDPIFAPIVAARSLSDNREQLRATVSGPGRWVLTAQLPLVAIPVFAGGTVLSVYGSGFRDGALWIALLGLAHGANSFAGLVETLLMVERPMLNLINAAATVVAQVVTGLVLIPRLGVTGAALSMLIGFTVQGILRFAEVRHVFGWSWPWASLSRPVVAALVAGIPAAAVRFFAGSGGEVPAGLLFLALYFGTWFVLGAEPEDQAVWRRLLKRD